VGLKNKKIPQRFEGFLAGKLDIFLSHEACILVVLGESSVERIARDLIQLCMGIFNWAFAWM